MRVYLGNVIRLLDDKRMLLEGEGPMLAAFYDADPSAIRGLTQFVGGLVKRVQPSRSWRKCWSVNNFGMDPPAYYNLRA